jgi:hypothetical protein
VVWFDHFHNRTPSNFQRTICCRQQLTGKFASANSKTNIAGLVAAIIKSELEAAGERAYAASLC